jgi:hypothetical protein
MFNSLAQNGLTCYNFCWQNKDKRKPEFLGLLADLTFSCSAFLCTPVPVILSRIPPVLWGWHKEWKIMHWQKDTRKESPATSFKTYLKTWANRGFNRDWNDSKSHDQSLSLDQVSSVPLVRTRAKVSIDIMADQFALEHMPLLLLSILRQQEEMRMYFNIELSS